MKTFFIVVLFTLSYSLIARECNLKSPLKSYHPQYATHFSIDYYESFKILHVDNEQYLLSNSKKLECELAIPQIMIPVKKVVMMSTTYLPALELIHQENSLIGFQGKGNIVSSAFHLNQIKEVAFKFNPEYLLGLKADLIMGYDANLTSPKQRQIFNSLKIPVVINKDFEEKTPLGRAEWLIFISSFYNQDEKAISLFNSIQKTYLELKARNLKIENKPHVIVGEIQSGYWVTCGGESDLAQLIEDAGGKLEYKHTSAQTQKINLEELAQNKKVFDIWLTHNMWSSRRDLTEAYKRDNRYTLITAKNIFNNNLLINASKANDYWETALQRPDLLLLDLSAIFHPEVFKDHKTQWYRKL